MIALGDVLISDEIIEEHFVCDLHRCKGGCCVDGDCGAPLTDAEASQLSQIYPKVQDYIPEVFQEEVAAQGYYVEDDEYGKVTPTKDGGVCVYAFYDEHNIVKCGIQQAFLDGAITVQKPISCHLFPIRVTEAGAYTMLNYEPRPRLCKPACKLGNQLKIPVYEFLKEPLMRRFGSDLYEQLEKMASDYREFKRK